MGIDQVVVIAFTIVVFLALFVFSIDLLDPWIAKLAFDEVCRMYILLAESNNGLTDVMKQELESELANLSLMEVTIGCDDSGNIKRGERSELEVEASYTTRRFASLFKRETQSIRFFFRQSFVARRIVM